jgi:hypothetical protein
MMALRYIYEQDYLLPGWLDDGGGATAISAWYDHDVSSDRPGGPVIPLYTLEPGFFRDGNDVFWTSLPGGKSMFTTELHPILFIDEDLFYIPMSVRALTQPIQMLRNEIRRVR